MNNNQHKKFPILFFKASTTLHKNEHSCYSNKSNIKVYFTLLYLNFYKKIDIHKIKFL